jgi:hypothetical protein
MTDSFEHHYVVAYIQYAGHTQAEHINEINNATLVNSKAATSKAPLRTDD